MATEEHEGVDSEIIARLSEVTPEQWDALESARRGLSGPGPHGSWGGGEESSSGVFNAPFAIEGPDLRAAGEVLGAAGLLVPFDWSHWDRGRAVASDRAQWDALDPVTSVKLWVAVTCNARFSEGAMLDAADSGLLAAVLAGILRARPGA